MSFRFPIALTLAAVVLTACGTSTPVPATQLPASVPPAITITGPTSSAPPPAVTLTCPTAAPTETQAPIQPTAEAVMGPETYPARINPLTGLAVDEAVLNHRILAVKVANFPYYVRPRLDISADTMPYACQKEGATKTDLTNACAQSGLSQADIVFEHYAEGGTTRFTALFYGQMVDRIGPIRSARLIDTIIPEMFKSALVASGSSNGVLNRLNQKDWFNLVVAETTGFTCPLLCPINVHPNDPDAFPDANSIFTSTTALHDALAAKNLDVRQPFRGVAYFNQPPANGAPVTGLRVEYSGAANAEWAYDAASNRYLRSEDNSAHEMQPHLDSLDNKQISAANVVVLFVNHVVDVNIPEDYENDATQGHFSTEVQLWATGPAWLLRDGQVFKATWVRLNAGDTVGLVDEKNQVIPFKPGNTWYEVVGLTSETVTDGVTWRVKHRSPQDLGAIPGAATPVVDPNALPAETATP
jgi:Protein of unknown function (DUF3048) C-terminal domain/Protein of unknown function (DUF3048) N-terminal domain